LQKAQPGVVSEVLASQGEGLAGYVHAHNIYAFKNRSKLAVELQGYAAGSGANVDDVDAALAVCFLIFVLKEDLGELDGVGLCFWPVLFYL